MCGQLIWEYCLSIEIAHTIDSAGGLLFGIVLTIELGYCQLIGIASKIDLEGGLLIGIVRTVDFGYCLLIRIARTIDLEGGLLIVLVGTNDVGDGQLIGCLLYTSPSPRDKRQSRMPSSA